MRNVFLNSDADFSLSDPQYIWSGASLLILAAIFGCVALAGYSVYNHDNLFLPALTLFAMLLLYWGKTGICNFIIKAFIIIALVLSIFVPGVNVITFFLWRKRKLDWLITSNL